MATTTTTHGVVKSVDHAATSRNGNPTYRIQLVDGRAFLTATDAQIGYAATNYRPRHGADVVRVILTLDGHGRVTDITRED